MEMGRTPLSLKPNILGFLIDWRLMGVIAFIEYRFFSDFAYIVYSIALFLLILVLGYGLITSGAQRWVRSIPLLPTASDSSSSHSS